MLRHLIVFTLCVLVTPWAQGDELSFKLLNPDGSAAVDAQAIAIKLAKARVNSNLKELPRLDNAEKGDLVPRSINELAVNESGTIKFESGPFAILAQSKSGFAFIPLPMPSREVKLRPWTKLTIDLSARKEPLTKTQRLYVLWENCFAGYPPRPSGGNDENSNPFDPRPRIDWRFDPLVMWSLKVDTQTEPTKTVHELNVPPGEVTLMISDGDFEAASFNKPVAFSKLDAVRTISGKQVTYKVPDLVTVTGKVVEDAGLPDWNKASDRPQMLNAFPAAAPVDADNTAMAQMFSGLDKGPGSILDELARRYTSEQGLRYRYELVRHATAIIKDDGTFQVSPPVPGPYELFMLRPSDSWMVPLNRLGEKKDAPFLVHLSVDSKPMDIGQFEPGPSPTNPAAVSVGFNFNLNDDPFAVGAGPSAPVPTRPNPVSPNPFGTPSAIAPQAQAQKKAPLQAPPDNYQPTTIEAVEQAIHNGLMRRVQVDYAGLPLNAALDDLARQGQVPIRINEPKLQTKQISVDQPLNMQLPDVTLQSALRHILASVSDQLAFVVRDEVLLITTKEDAASVSTNGQPLTNPALKNLKKPELESERITRSQLFSLEAEEQRLRSTIGEGHPRLAAVRQEIALIKRQIEQQRAHEQNEMAIANQARSKSSETDSSDAVITQWLERSLAENAALLDVAALRKALKEQVEKEFDAKQKSRQTEIARLRNLLKQSEDWLSNRQSHREEIINRKVDDLMDKVRTSK